MKSPRSSFWKKKSMRQSLCGAKKPFSSTPRFAFGLLREVWEGAGDRSRSERGGSAFYQGEPPAHQQDGDEAAAHTSVLSGSSVNKYKLPGWPACLMSSGGRDFS